MTADIVIAAGVADGARRLAEGRTVVVVDRAEALVALLDGRGAEAHGRLAVFVGDPDDLAALDAAAQMAQQLFPSQNA